MPSFLKEQSHGSTAGEVKPKFFNFVVCNPCQSSPSLTILVPLCFIIISLVLFFLCKVLFSGFLQFKGNSVDSQNNSKYYDCAPISIKKFEENLCLPYIFLISISNTVSDRTTKTSVLNIERVKHDKQSSLRKVA